MNITGIEHRPLPSDDPKRRQPDITKQKKFLGGWEPKIDLDDGLSMTIRDFETRAKARPQSLECAHQKEQKSLSNTTLSPTGKTLSPTDGKRTVTAG